MDRLIENGNTAKFLKDANLSPKKKYGQNFLIDKRILERIIEGAVIGKSDTVLEIGPGLGTLSQAICEKAGELIAIEIDRDMIPVLEGNLAGFNNYRIINGDILKSDLGELLGGKKVKVVANLPYYITTPIIMKLLEETKSVESITVMVQKEVADRMRALPGTKDYGALTVAVNYYSTVTLITNVPANSFMPRPTVDSAVVKLSIKGAEKERPKDEKLMFGIIKAAFSKRRKTLVNALSLDNSLAITKEAVLEALSKMNLNSDIRGERLSLGEFITLSDILGEIR